ncbi:MAG: phosphoribosylanthranilate isomerase [Patescibacteria group bacterium]
MPIKVKICGIKSREAAKASIKFGADFLGFNFVPTSKRFVSPALANKIIASLPRDNKIVTVGVFMNQSTKEISDILSKVKLDLIQFHGNESPKFCENFSLPYIKAFGLGKNASVKKLTQQISKYKAKYFLLDRPKQGKGQAIDLKKVGYLAKQFPIILAGALMPENVQSSITQAGKIVGVDVAGGVEINGGKNLDKIRAFIFAAKKFNKSRGH